MIKTFTRDDLIRYIYGETTKLETESIENEVLCDNDAHQQFNEMIELKQTLDKVKYEPSKGVVESIINYSRSYEMPEYSD